MGYAVVAVGLVWLLNLYNFMDGIDGIASVEAICVCLGGALLYWLSDHPSQVLLPLLLALAVSGFLYWNFPPARIFMGDAGSQVLGFTTGVLVVLLTQSANQALSPAAALLILGLPLADLVVVVAQRTWQGVHWFRAGKNHLHHRLLELGFSHYEAVVLVYSAQAVFVLSGVLLRYADDALVLAVYLLLESDPEAAYALSVALVAVCVAVLAALRGRWWGVRR